MSPRAWFAFCAVAVLWGIPYFLIKVAVTEVAPSVVSVSRLAIGALILLPIAWRRGAARAALRHWPWVVALGVGYLALALTLIPVAETFISSSLTAILIATVPMVVAVISLRWRTPTLVEIAGLVVGFAGVATLVGLAIPSGGGAYLGVGTLVVVVLAYALGPIVASVRLGGVEPIGYMSVAMAVAVIVLVPVAILQRPTVMPSLQVDLALAGLGVLCTAIPYGLYFGLVADAGPQRATLVTYINPAVAVVLGVAVLHERFGWSALLGLVMILAGSWLATRTRRPGPSTATPAELSA